MHRRQGREKLYLNVPWRVLIKGQNPKLAQLAPSCNFVLCKSPSIAKAGALLLHSSRLHSHYLHDYALQAHVCRRAMFACSTIAVSPITMSTKLQTSAQAHRLLPAQRPSRTKFKGSRNADQVQKKNDRV
jgi:hypothetical protein